jgi:hypothetical protein
VRGGFAPPPQPFATGGGRDRTSDVAVAGDGSAIAVWDVLDASGTRDVWTARRAPNGIWSAASRLSPDDGLDDRGARIVIDRHGVATAAWSHGAFDATSVLAARRAGGDAWQPVQAISAVQQMVFAPDLAVDRQGNVTVAWVHNRQNRGVEAATWLAGSGWQPPVTIAPGGWADTVSVAASRGRAAIVWQRSEPDLGSIWSAYKPSAASAWEAETQLTPVDEFGSNPHAAFDADGAVVAVWSASDGSIRATQRPAVAGGAWSAGTTIGSGAPSTFALGEQYGSDLTLAAGPRGDLLAIWGGSDDVFRRVRAAERPSGGSWSAAPDVAIAGAPIASFDVALARDGAAVATWNEGAYAVGAWRPAGGSWQRTTFLSPVPPVEPSFASPAVAANRRGDLAAIWETDEGVATIGGRLR